MSWQSCVVSCIKPKFEAKQAIDGLHWIVSARSDGAHAWGTANTKFEAATKALAELVERTSIQGSSEFRIKRASAEELNELDWLRWASPTGQIDSSLYDAEIHWIEGYELETRQQRFVPAHSVFPSWKISEPWEFRRPLSCGTAVHVDKQLALRHAYSELLERHTVMLHFFAGYLGDVFNGPFNHYIRSSCEVLGHHHVRPYFYRMKIPREIDIYVAYLESPNIPRLTAGAGTTPGKALAEALQGRTLVETYLQFNTDERVRHRDEITGKHERAVYWACSGQPTPRESMRQGSPPEVEPGLSKPVFVVDLTRGIVSEIGLHAVKVVAPSALSVFGPEREYQCWIELAKDYLKEYSYPVPHFFW